MNTRRKLQRGVVLPLVLMLLSLLSLLLTQGLLDAAAERALATQWQLRQSVFNAAGNGIAQALQQLPASGTTLPPAFTVVSAEAQAQVQWLDHGYSTAEGYSADLYRTHHLQVQSTGTAARGARLQVSVGLQRTEPF